MSRLNGDKSRYNRLRKQKLDRRKRTRSLFLATATATVASSGPTNPGGKPEASTTRRKSPE
jgi:hypothetical protein